MTKTTTMFLAVAMVTAASFASPRKAAEITVSGYTGTSTLENFPVLVRISPERISGFAYADCATGGADISFQDAAGNALDFEIDTWDTSGDSLVWVKVPSLSGNATKITFRWKDTNPAAHTPAATWNGYAGVWHLNEEEAGAVAISDSTENGVNGTAHSTSSSKTDGKVGRARNITTNTGHTPASGVGGITIDSANMSAINAVTPEFTVSMWARTLNAKNNYEYFISRKLADADQAWAVQLMNSYNPASLRYYSAGTADNQVANPNPQIKGAMGGVWHKYDFIWKSDGTYAIYIDGSQDSSVGSNLSGNLYNKAVAVNGTYPLCIGGTYPQGSDKGGRGFYGDMDEVRICAGVPSADWIAADYAQVNDPSFVTYGAAESLASDNVLMILGAPAELGSPTPAYGPVDNLLPNASVSLSMTPTAVPGEGTVTNYLKGWKLESVNLETGACTLLRTSSDAGEAIDRYAYTHASYAEFTWLWDVRDALGVGAPTLVSTSPNTLVLSVDVTGIGYTAPSATLKLAYGVSPDALVHTNVLSSSVAAIGAVPATLTRLAPGASYYVRALLETNDEAHDYVETEIGCFQTPGVFEPGMEPGLIQAKYADKWYTGAWDIAGAADATRVLGAWAAHCGSNFSGTVPWRSADGETSYSTWGDNTTWGYVGYMRFDNATYTFGGCMDDNVRLYINGVQVLDQSGGTLKTATWIPPNGADWYPIEIRVGNGSGGNGPYSGFIGLGWNTTGYTTKDTSANWHKFVDPGDGSLLRTAKGVVMTATENISGGALASVTINVPEASAARTLRVAWGPVHGGDDPADWYATSVAANVPAGATSTVWTAPADWGSESNLVVRFYFAGPPADWSNSIFWRDYSAPDIAGLVVDGTGGDTLVVSGDLASFPGADCVLTVYVGDSPTSLDTAWTGLAGATRTATGAFSLTLFEPDTAAARYLKPGATYYVAVEAVSSGQVSRTAVQEVTMSAAPVFALTSSSVARRTVTFTGFVADVGAGTAATITLYTGSSNSEEALARAESAVVTDRQTFSITHTFPDFETTYYWQLRATAEPDGGTTNFETRTAIASCKTLDTTTYTWKTSVSSGNWDDPANWTDNQYGDSLGYPQTTAATALFPAMTDAAVAFRRALSVGTLNLSANGIFVRFTQGGASTNETRLTANTLNMNGKGGAITLDGVAVTAGGAATLAAYRTLNLVNAANLHLGGNFDNQETNVVLVAGGSWLSVNEMHFGGGTITIDDSTVWTRSHDHVGRNRVGGRVIFKGMNPLWRHNNNGGNFFSNLANANVQLDFIVPAGGFAAAPIQAPANQGSYMGNNGNNAGSSSYTVNVLDESPANFADGTVTSPLISWPKGINKALFTEGHLPEDGAATDDAFAWGDASGYPTTLGVTIHGSSHAGQLQVSAAPEEVASAELSPAYGYATLAADATRTCATPSGYVQISADKRAICTGWKLYDVDPATHARTLADSGDGATCTVTGNGGWRELEWQWRVEYRVSATAGDNGSAAVAEEWVADGGLATVTATPAAGYAFYKWTGDVDANYDKEKTLTFAVDGQDYALNAVFAQIFYVSKTGSDANDGLSWATAKATIPAAVALSSTPYVLVSNGVYEITSAIQLTKGAIVEGTGDRGAVIKLTTSPPEGDSTRCAVYLNHADAAIRNLAVCGIYGQKNDQIARGICIDAGGLVENCSVTNNRTVNLNQSGAGIYLKAGGVVRGCLIEHNLKNTSGGGGGVGGGIHMKAGLVENCVIRDNRVADGSGNSYGGGVYVEGGTLRNSLVVGNYTQHGPDGSGVAILNGTVENCTIVGNYNRNSTSVVGLYFVPNGVPTMRNCIIWGNENVNGDTANWAVGTGVLLTSENNCSYPALPGSGSFANDPAFVDAANGDYRLMFGPAVNGAQSLGWMAASTDLDGNPRVFGPAPDLGCYERVSSSLDCGFDVAGDGSLDTAAVSATALVAGADPEDLTFTWTFTDTLGNVVTTNGAGLSSVTLPLATGLYDVSLAVTDGATTATAARPDIVRVCGSDVYVATDGGNVYPYATRATAATNLLDAIVAAGDGTTVHLAPGWHKIAQTLTVNVGARLVSDEGPEATVLFGQSVLTGLSAVILSHEDAVLSGVTISGRDENGVQLQQWGGLSITAAGGTLTNCVVRGHRTAQNSVSGAALRMSGGTVVDCVFSNNLLYCSGGWGGKGVINIDAGNALIDRCLIVDNTIADGSPSHGGGVYMKSGTIRNSLVAGNFAQGYGGGLAVTGTAVARNCTVVRNTSTIGSGGIYAENPANVIDCLAWGNTANGVAEDTDDPGFVDAEGGDYHLNVASAAVDASAPHGIGDLDLDGMPRYSGGVADKGCFEYDKNQFSIGISYAADSSFVEDPVVFTAAAPEGTVLDESRTWWTFDGTEPSASNFGARGAVVTNALPIGIHTVRFKTVYDGETYAFDRPDWVIRYGRTVYLVAENATPTPPYGTPETAATNLMDAFSYAIDGTTLLIGDGTFAIAGGQTLERHITVRSVNGPSRTTIDGQGASRRLDIKSPDVIVEGIRFFRLLNWQQGAAINMSAAGLVTNCVFDSCNIQNNGGAGVYMTAGTVVDCVFTNCHTISQYCVSQPGVALWANAANGQTCMIDRCLVIGTYEGGTIGDGAVYIGDNGGTIRNSVVAGSRLRGSGGIVAGKNAKVLNCTVTGNISTTAGMTAGVAVSNATAVVRNTIVWNNVNEADGVRAEIGGVGVPASFDHCFTDDPGLVGRPGRAYEIRSNSPCRNAGVTESWMTGALDFYRRPRIDKPNRGVDIGAAECHRTDGTVLVFR